MGLRMGLELESESEGHELRYAKYRCPIMVIVIDPVIVVVAANGVNDLAQPVVAEIRRAGADGFCRS